MENQDYAFGAVDLCAAGVGAPQIRQRLWFVGQRLADAAGERRDGREDPAGTERRGGSQDGSGLGGSGRAGLPERGGDGRVQREALGALSREAALGASDVGGLEKSDTALVRGQSSTGNERLHGSHDQGVEDGRACANIGWNNPDWLFCRDGRFRPVEPGTFPLAHGVSARVDKLRSYGNAIVPQVAATFVKAFLNVA